MISEHRQPSMDARAVVVIVVILQRNSCVANQAHTTLNHSRANTAIAINLGADVDSVTKYRCELLSRSTVIKPSQSR